MKFAKLCIVACLAVLVNESAVQAQNGVLREVYTNISGGSVANLTNHPSFPNSPASNVVASTFEAPQNIGDNYGTRMRALLLPPYTGNYFFWIASDDNSVLYLSSDASPANKMAIARVNGNTSSRQWDKETNQMSAPIYLVAGQRYYIEALHKESVGSDNLAVRWLMANGSIEEPIPNSRLLVYGQAAKAAPYISQQPVGTNLVENQTAFFRVMITNQDAVSYQWLRNGAIIPGAIGASYTITNASLSDSGASFQCVITNSLGVVTSASATLNVSADTVPPSLLGAASISSNSIHVLFSEPVVPADATDINNYMLNNGVTVLSASMANSNRAVILSTSPLTPDTTYTLTVSQIRDLASSPNVLAPSSQATFTVFPVKGAYVEFYTNVYGGQVANLTNAGIFPQSPSQAMLLTNALETPSNWGNSYGLRLRALLIPPATGQYYLWVAADESATLYLSANDSPNSKAVIAWTTNANYPRLWTQSSSQQSGPVNLTAGQRYYLEVLMKEGYGNDNLAVRWQLPGGIIEEPIPAFRMLPYGMPPPTITAQPAGVTVIEGQSASFRVEVSNVDPISYQWQSNGVNIAGATNPVLSLNSITLAANGARFRCLLSNPMGATNSTEAQLTVLPDTVPPTILEARNDGLTNVVLFFSEPLQPASATNPANYLLEGGEIYSATFRSNNLTVILTTSPLAIGNAYTIVVNNVQDAAATPNAIAPNTRVTFTAIPYFGDNIGLTASTIPWRMTPAGTNGYDITTGGTNIGGSADQFHFSYQQHSGDWDVRVRVQSLEFADTWTQAGLMARETLAPNSRYASTLATPSLAGVYFEYRDTAATASKMTGNYPVNYPHTWLRLQRTGNTFNSFASMDGNNWTLLGSASISMPQTVFLGLAGASYHPSNTVLVEFRDVSDVTTAAVAPMPAGIEPPGPSSRRTPIAITEIMYHPPSRQDGKNLEFVELFNSNPYPEDISSFRLSGDISYTFPANTWLAGGAFIIVAKNPADFQSVYSPRVPVYGPYNGSLPNDKGTLRLRNNLDAILLEINYESRAPWPAAADGAGHSLALTRPSYGEGDPRAWSQSAYIGGSPGRWDGGAPELAQNVVINEFLAHPGQSGLSGFIELYNRGQTPVDISGCQLSDDPQTNKFTIPAGTIIQPNSFIYFTEAELGFGLNVQGEFILLINASRTRVLDAIHFSGQIPGVSTGRSPDGAPDFQLLATPTPGATNSAPRPMELVINEIMYHPITQNSADEYVEIYNPGSSSVDLAGWEFTDGISFKFPAGAVAPPNGYIVVAKDKARLLSKYSNLNSANTFGNFEGTLSDRGEKLVLSMPCRTISTNRLGALVTNTHLVEICEVTYGQGGRWGKWSDGGGSSLELIDPHSDPRRAPNWADSDETAKSSWTMVETTGSLDNGRDTPNSLQIYTLDAGECLIDNVEVFMSGGLNLVPNPSFESGFNDWYPQGNQCKSSLAAGLGYLGGNCMYLRGIGRGDTAANRVRTTLTSSLATSGTATIRAMVRWLRGTPEILFRIKGNYLELPAVLSVPQNLGTPGAPNSMAVGNAGPAIYDVSHSPVTPDTNQNVVVSARLNDPDGIASATLYYRLDPSTTWLSLQLRDDGMDGDIYRGDGMFSATIPAPNSNAIVAFYIQTVDTRGAATRFPNDAPARECVIRFGDIQPFGAFGTYRFWVTQTNFDYWRTREKLSNEPVDGTFVYGNCRAIYNAGAQYAGSPYHSPNYNSPTGNNCDYYITLPPDDTMMTATEFTLQQPGNGGGDTTVVREQTAFWMAWKMGLPFNYRRNVNLYINGVRRGIIFEDTQQPNGDFLDQWYPDNGGDLYKVMIWFETDDAASAFTGAGASLALFTTTGGVKKLARYRQNWGKRAVQDSANNYTNLFQLVDTVNIPGTDSNYVRSIESLVDIEEWARIFAVERIVGNTDGYSNGGGQNMYAVKVYGARWNMLIWDIDFAFAASGPTTTLFTFTDTPITTMFNTPAFRRTYWRALRDAAYGPLDPAAVNPQVDNKYAAFVASGISASAPTGTKDYCAQRRDYIFSLLLANQAPLAITSSTNIITGNNTVSITGTAPLDAKDILVNGIRYPVTWTNITSFIMTLPVSAPTNYLLVQATDTEGRLLSNAAASLTIIYTNQIPAPEQSVVINEIHYLPSDPEAAFVELFNTSTNFTFDLSRWRFNGLDYTFPDGSTLGPKQYLVLARNPAAFAATFGTSIPVFGQFNGRLDKDGETLTLLRPVGTNEVVVDRVKYETARPWPQGPLSTGSSIQLIDPLQDNSRAGNWADVGGWQMASFTGTNTVVSPPILMLLPQGPGDVYIDDLTVVIGTNAATGSNVIVNGGFEEPLEGTWFVGTNLTDSMIVTNVKHSGNSCLLLRAKSLGSTFITSINQTNSAFAVSNVFTVSFWYLPVSLSNLIVRTRSSTFTPRFNVAPQSSATPGASNMVARTLPYLPPLWLNEAQPENLVGPVDNYGEHDPWIELYNSGTNTINLDGWFLSDNYDQLAAWPFPPGTSIGPGEFMIIWADGQPEQTTATALHTTFRLAPSHGSIALSTSAGDKMVVLDYLNYTNLYTGYSYGNYPDGQPFNRQHFFYTTPAATNNPAIAPLQVFINEWMASNTRTLTNAQGRFEDWFELYNDSNEPANLDGFYLTDNIASPFKFRIPPGYVIPPKGFLLVWADNRDYLNTNQEPDLHVNFQLSRDGESLGLFAPDGTPVSIISFGPQQDDVSQGHDPDGSGPIVTLAQPSPRASNRQAPPAGPPSLAPTEPIESFEGRLISFIAPVQETNQPPIPLAFQLLGEIPDGAVMDLETGVFSWTPSEQQGPGSYAISYVAYQTGPPYLGVTQLVTINVIESNQPPQLAAVADRLILPGHALRLTNVVFDPDWPANQFAFQLYEGPQGAAIDSNGILTYTPDSSNAGTTQTVTIVVTDNGVPPLSATQSFNIIIPPLPVIQSITHSDGQIEITWTAFAGVSYGIAFIEDPQQSGWTTLATGLTSNGGTLSYRDTNVARRRFYRIFATEP